MAPRIQSDGTPFNVLERNLKRLGMTMLLFSICDVVIALAVLLWPVLSPGTIQPGVHGSFYLFPLLHLVFPCFCIPAWMDTKRNIVIVASAIVARVIYTELVFVLILLDRLPPLTGVLGGIGLLFAGIHYLFLRLSDFGLWEVLSRAGNPPGVRK